MLSAARRRTANPENYLHGFARREYNILYRICSRIFTGSILHRRWPFWKGCGAAGFGRDTPDGADACFIETGKSDDQQRFCIAPAASDTRGGLRLLYGFCWPFRYIEQGKGHVMNYTYVVKCSDGTYYTGWTNNLEKRIRVHNEGKGAKYTRSRGPVELVYYEEFESKEEAMSREARIKRLTRKEKEQLIGRCLI